MRNARPEQRYAVACTALLLAWRGRRSNFASRLSGADAARRRRPLRRARSTAAAQPGAAGLPGWLQAQAAHWIVLCWAACAARADRCAWRSACCGSAALAAHARRQPAMAGKGRRHGAAVRHHPRGAPARGRQPGQPDHRRLVAPGRAGAGLARCRACRPTCSKRCSRMRWATSSASITWSTWARTWSRRCCSITPPCGGFPAASAPSANRSPTIWPASHLGEPRRLALALSELEKIQFSTHHLAHRGQRRRFDVAYKTIAAPRCAGLELEGGACRCIGLAAACFAGCAQMPASDKTPSRSRPAPSPTSAPAPSRCGRSNRCRDENTGHRARWHS